MPDMDVRRKPVGIGYLLLPCGFQGFNSDHQACQQTPLPMVSHLAGPKSHF